MTRRNIVEGEPVVMGLPRLGHLLRPWRRREQAEAETPAGPAPAPVSAADDRRGDEATQ